MKSDLDFYLDMKVASNRVKRSITTKQPGMFDELRLEYGATSTEGLLTPMVDKPREPESGFYHRLNVASTQLYQA